ncbi:MAG TPA: hypothetical protein QF772_10405 [Nitrospinaceae bacterium]|nr:hypothetical protein [Nitrospinaceae bacterium]
MHQTARAACTSARSCSLAFAVFLELILRERNQSALIGLADFRGYRSYRVILMGKADGGTDTHGKISRSLPARRASGDLLN